MAAAVWNFSAFVDYAKDAVCLDIWAPKSLPVRGYSPWLCAVDAIVFIMELSTPRLARARGIRDMARRSITTTITNYFEGKFLDLHLNLSDAAADQYRIAIRQFDRFHKAPVKIAELSETLILKFMRSLKAAGRSDRTANNKRQALLTIWRAAVKTEGVPPVPPVPKFAEPTRIVQAWNVAQVSRILLNCDIVPALEGWTGTHRRALLLTIYDTSHRVGALLDAPKSALDDLGRLFLSAEITKQKADTLHQLHAETLTALRAMPKSDSPFLFPWPLRRRAIWPDLRKILQSAGLPATRKDLFHKFRRTSFTYVWALMGPQAAREQAGHTSDLSAAYLDKDLVRSIQKLPNVIDVLPRPK